MPTGIAQSHARRPRVAPESKALLLILVAALILRLYSLGTVSLWTDELFTDNYSKLGLSFLWTEGLRIESNPPLYYSLVAIWQRLAGSSEFALRLPSVVCSLASIYAAYQLSRLLFRCKRSAVLAALLVALAPVNMFFAQEARAYALQGAALAFAMVGYATFLRNERAAAGLKLYGAAALIALYAHITSVFAIAAFNLGALLWVAARPRAIDWAAARAWLAANLVVGLLFLPLLRILQHADLVSWIAPPSRRGLESLLAEFLLGPAALPEKVWIARAVALLLLICIACFTWRRDRLGVLVLVVVPATCLASMVAVSFFTPVLLTRTVAWLAVPLCVLVADVLARRSRAVVLTSLALWVVLTVVDRRHADLVKENWSSFLAGLPRLDSSSLVVLGPLTPAGAIERYAHVATAPVQLVTVPAQPDFALSSRVYPVATTTPQDLAGAIAAGRSVWLILRGDSIKWAQTALADLPPPTLVVNNASDYHLRAIYWDANASFRHAGTGDQRAKR